MGSGDLVITPESQTWGQLDRSFLRTGHSLFHLCFQKTSEHPVAPKSFQPSSHKASPHLRREATPMPGPQAEYCQSLDPPGQGPSPPELTQPQTCASKALRLSRQMQTLEEERSRPRPDVPKGLVMRVATCGEGTSGRLL